MERPAYTFILNTYPGKERPEQFIRTLDSIFKQTYQNFKILIVENYENEEKINLVLKKYSQEMSRIKVIHDPKKKLSYLFDIGWRASETEFFAYVADDVEIENNWLQEINNEFESSKTAGVVTGPNISAVFPEGEMHRLYYLSQKNILLKILVWPYVYFAMENQIFKPGKLFGSGAYSMGAALKTAREIPRQEIDLATTSAMGIKREALEKVNGFDTRFNFNHADGDLFIRIKKLGYKIIFNPKVVSHHFFRLGPSRNAKIIGMDTARFYKKHIRPKSFRATIGAALNLLVLNLYWVYSAVRTRRTDQLKGISGFVYGILKKADLDNPEI